MSIIPISIFIILFATALLHLAWGLGLRWPGTDEQTLVNTVVGSPRISRMPPPPITIVVAIGIGAAGLCALWGAHLVGLPLPLWMRKTSIIVLTLIFAIRGLVTYLPNGPFSTSVEPFRTLNLIWFNPLILSIAAGYAFILFSYE